MISRPASVRTRVRVQSLKAPIPPVEMSACSAAKSGQVLQPSRVQAWHSLSGISWYAPSRIQIWKTPLMFILTMSARTKAVLGLEQLLEDGVVEGLGAQQADRQRQPASHLAGLAGPHDPGIDAWQLMPTRARRSRPRPPRPRRPGCWPSRCSGIPTRPGSPPGSGPRPGMAFHELPSPSSIDTRAASIRSCSRHHSRMADTSPPSWPLARNSGSVARARRRPWRRRPSRRAPAPGRRGSRRSPSPSCGKRGQARVQLVQPEPVPAVAGPSSSSRWNGGTPRSCRRSRARRGGRPPRNRHSRCTGRWSPPR
jgi:hypothetical protein